MIDPKGLAHIFIPDVTMEIKSFEVKKSVILIQLT